MGSQWGPLRPPWPPHHPGCPAAPRAAASPSPSKTNWRPARSLCLDRNVPSDSFLKQKPGVDIERGVIANTAGRGCTCWYKSHAAAQPTPAEPHRGQRRHHEAPLLPRRALPRPGQWLEEVRGGPRVLGCSQRGFNTTNERGKGSQVGLTHLVQAPGALWGHLHPQGDLQRVGRVAGQHEEPEQQTSA